MNTDGKWSQEHRETDGIRDKIEYFPAALTEPESVTPVRSSRLKAVKIDLGAANFLGTARVMRCFVKHDLAPEQPVNSSTTAPTTAAFAIEARPPTGVTDSGSEKAPGLPGVIDAAQTASKSHRHPGQGRGYMTAPGGFIVHFCGWSRGAAQSLCSAAKQRRASSSISI